MLKLCGDNFLLNPCANNVFLNQLSDCNADTLKRYRLWVPLHNLSNTENSLEVVEGLQSTARVEHMWKELIHRTKCQNRVQADYLQLAPVVELLLVNVLVVLLLVAVRKIHDELEATLFVVRFVGFLLLLQNALLGGVEVGSK